MIKFNNIIKTETYIELDAEDGGKMFMPASATIFVDDNSNAISVKTTGSRKTIGYVISGGTPPVPPVPPEPFTGKWKATYNDGHIESGECTSETPERWTPTPDEVPNMENIKEFEIGTCVDYFNGGFFTLQSALSFKTGDVCRGIGKYGAILPACKYIEFGTKTDYFAGYAVIAGVCEEVVCKAINPPEFDSDFPDWLTVPSTCKIYVPDESVDRYKAHWAWVMLKDQIYPMSQRP